MGENTITQVGDAFAQLGEYGLVGIVLAVVAAMLIIVLSIIGAVAFFMKGGFIDSFRALISQVSELNTRSTNLQAVTDKQEEAIDRHSDILVDHEGRIVTLEHKKEEKKNK